MNPTIRRSIVIPALALWACANPAAPPGMGMIGAQGGMLSSPDGVTIVVPPGAVDTPIQLQITKTTVNMPGMLGDAYQFGPTGHQFLKPVTVTLPFKHGANLPAGVTEPVYVFHAPTAAGPFTNLGGTEVSPGMVQAQTSSFSVFVAGTASPTLVADQQGYPQGIAVSGNTLYWTNYGTSSAPLAAGLGNVMSVTLGSSTVGTPAVVATSQPDPKQVAVNSSFVYWTDGGSGTGAGDAGIMRAPAGGGAATRIATASFPVSIALDSTSVYWLDYDLATVNKANLDGTSPAVVAMSGVRPTALSVDGTNAYWLARGTKGGTDGQVLQAPLSGSGPVVTVAMGQAEPSALAIDSTSIYWLTSDGAVRMAPIGGGTATTLQTLMRPTAIVVDSTYYYVADVLSGRLLRYPKAGGAGVARSTTEGFVVGLTQDATNLYWTNNAQSEYLGDVRAITKM